MTGYDSVDGDARGEAARGIEQQERSLDWNQYAMFVVGRTGKEQPSQDVDFNQRLYTSSQKFFSRIVPPIILPTYIVPLIENGSHG